MSLESSADTPQSILTRRCPQCGTLMTPARYDPHTGIAERFRLPGLLGGDAIRLACENGHMSVFLVRDILSSGGEGDAK